MTDDKIEQARATLLEAGQRRRQEVLGEEWVEQSQQSRTEFNGDFQDLIARSAWQEIWLRDGLDERTRRLLTIAITAALGRWEEFRLHVSKGLEHDGFTRDELKETLLQLAVYAGVPAANTAFKEAQRILTEQDG